MKSILCSIVFSSLGFSLISTTAFGQQVNLKLTPNGDKAVISAENVGDQPCYVDFEVKAKFKLTSSGSSEWHRKLLGSWKLPAGTARSEELYENDAEAWNLKKISNRCD